MILSRIAVAAFLTASTISRGSMGVVKFGDDGSEQYAALAGQGAFSDCSSEKIFEEQGKGILAAL